MSPSRAAAHAKATDGRLIWWAGKESEATYDYTLVKERAGWRIRDGRGDWHVYSAG